MTDQQQVAETELRPPPDDSSADPPPEDAKPHPIHPPAPESAAEPVPAVAPASPEPTRWGRAEPDGTIYLCTADGERVVGSWQAGDPADGLAHYARRFDDLLTEAVIHHAGARVERVREQIGSCGDGGPSRA